jgi:hypothetical protein
MRTHVASPTATMNQYGRTQPLRATRQDAREDIHGAILPLWPDAAARFYRYIVCTRPPYRRPFLVLLGPVDRSAMRGGAVGYLLLGVGAVYIALRT